MHTFIICLALYLTSTVAPARFGQESAHSLFSCSQPPAEQNALMLEAEINDYTIRRVEFLGNQYTRDQVLRGRMMLLQEGELFSRKNLDKSLDDVSKLKIIYPVRLRDVVIHLDRDEKLVDMEVCFRERRSKSGPGKRTS
jgi:hypothetical protein